jgi:hypothetical protein
LLQSEESRHEIEPSLVNCLWNLRRDFAGDFCAGLSGNFTGEIIGNSFL